MKAINFINWKYIGLTGCLVASLLTACGDDETGPEVVMPLEPKLEKRPPSVFLLREIPLKC